MALGISSFFAFFEVFKKSLYGLVSALVFAVQESHSSIDLKCFKFGLLITVGLLTVEDTNWLETVEALLGAVEALDVAMEVFLDEILVDALLPVVVLPEDAETEDSPLLGEAVEPVVCTALLSSVPAGVSVFWLQPDSAASERQIIPMISCFFIIYTPLS